LDALKLGHTRLSLNWGINHHIYPETTGIIV
jgi:hypothetical protein